MPQMRHIFVSYAYEDKNSALEVYELLKRHGFSVWLDIKSLLPGQDWKKEIEIAIRESEIFIACLSRNSVNKRGFVQSELKKALEVLDTIPNGDIYIIPVRFDDCAVPNELLRLHWLNFFESDAKDRLINAIQYHLKFIQELSIKGSYAASDFLTKLIMEAGLSEFQLQILDFDMNGYSTDVISKKLGKSIDVIYSRRSEAMRKLRKAAKKYYDR